MMSDFRYEETAHFKAAQAGNVEAKRIFKDESWCYAHGLLAELLSCYGESPDVAKRLLEEVRNGAEIGWTLANPNKTRT